ncbi:hypothetical protein MMC09_002414 [Bachmanniomyces sp. S44760]|nr:hypothetical protein [Bachmanniomyces sp. S44760]
MSFLSRTLPTLRCSTAVSTTVPRAAFSTSIQSRKSAIDAAKDTLKDVDRKISDAAVKGIEKGEQAAESTKHTIGMETSEARSEAKSKASELSGKAQGTAREAKGKAHEVAGQAKGKAEELKGEAEKKM